MLRKRRGNPRNTTRTDGDQATIHDVIRVTAENFKTPCEGILSTAATAHGAPASALTPKTQVRYCNTPIDLATAERLGLVRRDTRGNYVEAPGHRRQRDSG
jgi:hypothetical protein